MRRGLAVLFFLLLFIIAQSIQTSTADITIEGKATSQISTSIQILNAGPIITIIAPYENRTYRNTSILLNYSLFDHNGISSARYNLDHGANTSLGNSSAGSLYFSVSEGSHTLHLYTNDTLGNSSYANVSFFANNTKIVVVYEDFRGNKKGNSNDFDSLDEEQLENLSGMILEYTDYGKIEWQEIINLTEDENASDRITYIDNKVIIRNGSIFVNETTLPNLNKRAALYFYNMTFDNPRVLRDGDVCPSSVCTNQSYTNHTFYVDVTGFTNYSLEETPEEEAKEELGPGGGGGGGIGITKGFDINKDIIKVKLKQGETKEESIILRNTGIAKIKVNISTPTLEDFVKISEESFEINAGETKKITLDFIAREETPPDLYIGKLIINVEGIEKEVLISIEVTSKNPLLDVKVEIPKKFQYVMPGEELMTTITLRSLGKVGRVDVALDYIIKNSDGETILHEDETLAVETQTTFTKNFIIPQDAEYGNYAVYVKATYDNETASTSAWFNVGKQPSFLTPFLGKEGYIIAGVFVVVILIITLFMLREIRKIKKSAYVRHIDENIILRKNLIKARTK